MDPLQGLTQHTNNREQAYRDISVLERMSAQMDADKQADLQAQREQQLFFERMYQQADQLLDKDRKRVNNLILTHQNQLENTLSEFGGSKATFLSNGGYSTLNNMENSIVRSDEMSRYKANKESLARIFQAQAQGLGHLLTPQDLNSLEAYENNEEGAAITYSGLMNEVELPPSDLFDYGQEIPAANILGYGGNAIKILANYQMAYPDRPEPDMNTPEGRAQVVAFMKKMGYGGLGSNTTRMKERYALEKKRLEHRQKTSTDPKESNSFLYAVSETNKQIPSDLKVENVVKNYKEGSFINELKNKPNGFKDIIGEKFTEKSRRRGLSDVNTHFMDLGEIVDRFGQDQMGLKESYKLALTQSDHDKIAKAMMGTYMDENGMIKKYTPSTSVDYRADGTIFSDDNTNHKDVDDYAGDYKPLGFVTALKSSTANNGKEEPTLLVNAYNEDGTIDQEASEKLYKNADGSISQSDVEMVYVLAMKGEEDGDLIYKEVDFSQPAIQSAFKESIATTDDITSITQQRDRTAQTKQQVEALNSEEQIQFEGTKRELNQTVFQDPIFKQEGENFYGQGSAGTQNRYNMMKSFYMAFDFIQNNNTRNEEYPNGNPSFSPDNINKYIDDNVFSVLVSPGAGDIEESLKDYGQGNSEEAIIDRWLENMCKDLDPQKDAYDIRENKEVAMKWKQYLGLL